MLPNDIQAITFDIGGTLIQPWPSVGQIYSDTAARHGHPNISPQLLKQRFVAAWRVFKDFNHNRAHWERLVDATFDGLIPVLPSRTFFPELYDHFTRPEAWRIFPDVLPALRALAARSLKLGVISNWDDRLRSLLGQLNLTDFFHTIVISCEVGAAKPSPVIFEAAAEKLELPRGVILHVGDSPPNDADGARAAGFQSVLLLRGATGLGPNQISSLQQLYSEPL